MRLVHLHPVMRLSLTRLPRPTAICQRQWKSTLCERSQSLARRPQETVHGCLVLPWSSLPLQPMLTTWCCIPHCLIKLRAMPLLFLALPSRCWPQHHLSHPTLLLRPGPRAARIHRPPLLLTSRHLRTAVHTGLPIPPHSTQGLCSTPTSPLSLEPARAPCQSTLLHLPQHPPTSTYPETPHGPSLCHSPPYSPPTTPHRCKDPSAPDLDGAPQFPC